MTIENVLASLIGGILVVIVIWLWNVFWPTVVWPTIAIKFQKNEPRIAGKWKTAFEEDGESFNETVTLKQRGRKISAIIILREDEGEIIYEFKGTFQNLILSGTYTSKDDANFERGAILLRYVRKDKFRGKLSFFSKTSDDLVSSPYEWTRA